MTNQRPTPAPSRRKVLWLIPCLLLAALLFYLKPPSSSRETDMIIPVEFLGLKEGLTTARPLEANVEIRVSGPEASLADLKNRKITCALDLSGIDAGPASFPVDPACIQLPKRVSIVKIRPAYLNVVIEPEIKIEAPVVVSLTGNPAPGFIVEAAAIKPGVVTLRGARSRIEPIDKIRTKPLEVDGLSESTKKEVALDLPEGVVAAAPSELIFVELAVREKIDSRVFNNIPVPGKDASFSHRITPSEIRVEVKGPVSALDKLQTGEGLDVYVDLKGLEPGVYARRAVIHLPVGVNLIAASPEIFTVRISKKKMGSGKGKG
ncbi:MAG: hypothetical protein GY859_21600 [Desulfobacterales bacterium]|nr:hypothetical protein [Desulfobacterales bacterium]